MIFGKRAIQLKFVKPDKTDETIVADNDNVKTFREYAEVVKDVAGDLATMIIVVTVVKAACDIGRSTTQGIFK